MQLIYNSKNISYKKYVTLEIWDRTSGLRDWVKSENVVKQFYDNTRYKK